jgi:hypothetical protein
MYIFLPFCLGFHRPAPASVECPSLNTGDSAHLDGLGDLHLRIADPGYLIPPNPSGPELDKTALDHFAGVAFVMVAGYWPFTNPRNR